MIMSLNISINSLADAGTTVSMMSASAKHIVTRCITNDRKIFFKPSLEVDSEDMEVVSESEGKSSSLIAA